MYNMATMKKKTTFMLIALIITLVFEIRYNIISFQDISPFDNPIIDEEYSQRTLDRNVPALALGDTLQTVKKGASTESDPNVILSSPELTVVKSTNKSILIGGHINIPAPHSRIGTNDVKGFVYANASSGEISNNAEGDMNDTYTLVPRLFIGSTMRNEGPYLKEWIEFHLARGFEKFYIADNDSTDDSLNVLGPYVIKGIVELIREIL